MITKTGPRDMHLMRVLACDYVRARRREIIAEVNREVRRLEDRRQDIQSSRKQLMRQLATTMEFDQQVSVSFLGTQLAHEVSSTFSESYGTTGQCVFITSSWMEGEEEKHDGLRVIPRDKLPCLQGLTQFNEETLQEITVYSSKFPY
ncbi:hypothetical protein EV122DRAFT_206658 [Schizophyllum commune]